MTQTLNDNQLEFCRLIVGGEKKGEAYLKAFGLESDQMRTAATNASRLLKNADIQRKLEELRKEADNAALLTIKEKREFLARVVRTPLAEVDQQSDLCQEYTETVGENGGSTKIKMLDKLKAIDLDSRLAGHYSPEQVQVVGLSEIGEVLAAIPWQPLVGGK